MLQNLLSKAKELFTSEEDQKRLAVTEQHAQDIEAIKDLANSDGGKLLLKDLVNDFFSTLKNLIETREDKYISDLKSIMDMINKLSVNQELEAIRSYLERSIEPYEKN